MAPSQIYALDLSDNGIYKANADFSNYELYYNNLSVPANISLNTMKLKNHGLLVVLYGVPVGTTAAVFFVWKDTGSEFVPIVEEIMNDFTDTSKTRAFVSPALTKAAVIGEVTLLSGRKEY